jgi:WD40 repeat protein
MDAKFVVSGSSLGCIMLWLTETGEYVNTIKGHRSSVSSVAISEDNKFVVSRSFDKTVALWSTDTFEKLQVFKHSSRVRSVAITREEIVSTDDLKINVWSVETGECIETEESSKFSVEEVTERLNWDVCNPEMAVAPKSTIEGFANKSVSNWDPCAPEAAMRFVENWKVEWQGLERFINASDTQAHARGAVCWIKVILA